MLIFFCDSRINFKKRKMFLYIKKKSYLICRPKESNFRKMGNEPTLRPPGRLNELIYRAVTFFGFFFEKIQTFRELGFFFAHHYLTSIELFTSY